ncbi:DUF6308 family protein [Brachybacterium halotolerans subsp. kimchii]|uniref:DUF6308 family protein n=1 Tax=Brachybacterium halotolerans TaxID=2795215 RepID=UPI001E36B7A3|nr:DUF6308 family protein [Brachybacterium halotolerans]UEJ81856.1 DUF6308 family protein [Brachybacterium halotolerans subsp. kimchii]
MPAMIPDKFQRFRKRILEGADDARFVQHLSDYAQGGRFTGAYFQELTLEDPTDPDEIDIADIAALSLLEVKATPKAAGYLLKDEDFRKAFRECMSAWPDRDLADLSPDEAAKLESDEGLNPAWRLVKAADDFGPTRTAKLLARKRPRLIPIWDSFVEEELGFANSNHYWTAFHAALTEDDRALHTKLEELADDAGVRDRYSHVRVLDIVVWMERRNSGPSVRPR